MRGLAGDHYRIDACGDSSGVRDDALGRPAPLATVGAVADSAERPRHRVHATADRRTGRLSPANAACAPISTVHVSPTLSPRSGAALPISRGEPASTHSRSARRRTGR